MIAIRIISAQPSKDGEKVTIEASRHSDDWFTDLYAQNPQPFYRNPFSSTPTRPPYPWRTGNSPNGATDPLLPFPANSAQVYRSGAGIYVIGSTPINSLSTLTAAPQVPVQATVGSGGSIPAGTYVLALCAIDGFPAGGITAPSQMILVVVPSGSSTITIPNIVWASGSIGYQLFAGYDSQHMWGVHSDTTTPSSITITDLNPTYNLNVADVGRPDQKAANFKIIVTPIRHGGVWGGAVTAVGTHTLTVPSTPTVNQWAGRVISRYASATVINSGGIGSALLDGLSAGGGLHMSVSSNDNTGVITVPNTLTGLGGVGAAVGDVYVMRAYANIASANTIGDSNFVNSFSPSGLGTNQEAGKIVWIISGTGAGQRANVASNTSTTLTIDGSWATTPDATSVFIVLEPSPILSVDSNPFNSSTWNGSRLIGSAQLPITQAGSYLIQIVTEDADGNTSIVAYAPWQEVYLVPPQTASIAYSVPVSSGVATPDASKGDNFLVLNAANTVADSNGNPAINVAQPVGYDTTPGVYTKWSLIVQQDPATPSGGYSTIFDPSGATYKIGFAVASVNSPANTQCHVDFKTDWNGITTPTGCLIDQPIS